jgi:hypothetical protein
VATPQSPLPQEGSSNVAGRVQPPIALRVEYRPHPTSSPDCPLEPLNTRSTPPLNFRDPERRVEVIPKFMEYVQGSEWVGKSIRAIQREETKGGIADHYHLYIQVDTE